MATFYKRYLAGEHEAAWKELIRSGSTIRSDSLRSDVNDVAKVMVERAYNNLCLIHRRLLDLGYQFDDAEAALLEASPKDVHLPDSTCPMMPSSDSVLHALYQF